MKILKGINLTAKVSGYIGGAAVVVLMLLMVADILMRRFFAMPIVGATEIAQLAMIIIFVGVAYTTLENKQVKVDSLMECFPVKVQNVIDMIIYLFTLCFDLWLGWQTYQMGFLKQNQIYSMLKLPVSPFYWVLSAAFFLTAIAVIGKLIIKAREVAGK